MLRTFAILQAFAIAYSTVYTGGIVMEKHKQFGILALVCLLLTFFSGICKPIRKVHGCFGCLTLLFMIGAVVSGHSMISRTDADRDEGEEVENA